MPNQQNKESLECDFCVIGAGSGGLSFAAGAAQMGASVILLEAHKMGGDCLNYGCIPSKALLAAAKFDSTFKNASKFGWFLKNQEVDFKKVHQHVQDVIATIAPHDSVERFTNLGVRVIQEYGQFHDENTVVTDSYKIKAKRFIIATGSTPNIPNIPCLAEISYYTNETIFNLQDLPDHLLIIGGGPIGIEMAQAFRRLGSKVTVLQSSTILAKDDPEIVNLLKATLEAENITIHEHAMVLGFKKHDSYTQCTFTCGQTSETTINFTHLLIASGRRPTIDNLNLTVAKIAFTNKGILVDKSLRTSNRRVYAIGDCIGGYQFTHVAGYHSGLVIRNSIFKLPIAIQTTAIPWVTYTDPELAHVGYQEAQLVQEKITYRTLRYSFKENDRAQAENKTTGIIKVFVSPKGNILGVSILGTCAGELIFPWVMAIQNNLKVSAIATTIAPYPTFSEVNKRVAGSFYAEKLFSSMMRKIVKLLMRITR